jgi:hypothetical protein
MPAGGKASGGWSAMKKAAVFAAVCAVLGGSATAYLLIKGRKAGAPEVPAAEPPPPEPAQAPVPAVLPPASPASNPPSGPAPAKARRRKVPASGDQTAAPPPAAPEARPDWGRKKKARAKPVMSPAPEAGPPSLSLPGIPNAVAVKLVGEEHPEAQAPEPAKAPASKTPPSEETLLAESAKEQFGFCHQLMRQGEFDDVFDSCLCSASREGPPYNGSKAGFVERASEDPQTEAGATFEILSAAVQDGSVLISGRWTLAEGSAVERTERWAMEDGRWCLAP